MQFEAWTPGFIPELVKAGQILLGLSVGLLLGHIKAFALANDSFNKLFISTVVVFVTAMVIALTVSLWLPATLIALYLPSGILFFTVLLSGAVAANIKSEAVVLGLSLLALLVLAMSSVPSQGIAPDKIIIVLVNIFGLVFLIGGASSLSYWAVFKQNRLWPKIGSRILGAWLLAISLMMLAFQQSNVVL